MESIKVQDNRIHVLAGSIKSGTSPEILQILGLGSCVALCFYSKEEKFGSMAHIMLPSSKNARTPELKGKYADSAIIELIKIFKKKKIPLSKVIIKITGASSMFASSKDSMFDIANRNIEAVKELLNENNLHIYSQDIGGNRGRTINFNLETGNIEIFHAGGKLKKVI